MRSQPSSSVPGGTSAEVIAFRPAPARRRSEGAPGRPPPEAQGSGPALVRRIGAHDLEAVTRVHLDAFPNSFLTSLGPELVEAFYACFLSGPEHFGWVAERDGRVVGFAFATRAPSALYQRFYRRHLLRVAAAVAGRALRNPAAAAHVLGHWRHAGPALRGLLRLPPRGAPTPRSGEARLLSIGVARAALRTGIGRSLVRALRRELAGAGVLLIGLTVLRSNAGALTFYRSFGFETQGGTDASIELRGSAAGPDGGGSDA